DCHEIAEPEPLDRAENQVNLSTFVHHMLMIGLQRRSAEVCLKEVYSRIVWIPQIRNLMTRDQDRELWRSLPEDRINRCAKSLANLIPITRGFLRPQRDSEVEHLVATCCLLKNADTA